MTVIEGTVLITEAEVRSSIRRVLDHAESIWDEWAWQVQNETWKVIGYSSWDEMRRAEYGDLTRISAPRAETPELVARFRSLRGTDGKPVLTQRETANTLGVSERTVKTYNEPTYQPRETKVQNCTSLPTAPAGVDPHTGEVADDYQPEPDKSERTGQTNWSHRVQNISLNIPMEELTHDELLELQGAVEYLHNYIKGELITRNGRN